MERIGWKMDAKAAMKEAAASPYWATVIFGSISLILAGIQYALDEWQNIILRFKDFSDLGQYIIISLIFLVVNFIISTWIQFGYNIFCMKLSNRDSSVSYGDLFPSASFCLKAIGLQLMISLLILLFCLPMIILTIAGLVIDSLLLVFLALLTGIPAIIASYSYTQSGLVLIENPSKKVMQCIKESRQMMKGNKLEYFILELSFIPWALLVPFTCMLAGIYVMPYMTITEINFYNYIKPREALYQEVSGIE
jgi:hypothetical protein